MEEKVAAVYVMVREGELTPEDGSSYEAPLARQRAECLQFLKDKLGLPAAEKAQFYASRRDLLLDIDRDRISHLIVRNLNRLGNTLEEIEGIKFALAVGGVALLVVEQG